MTLTEARERLMAAAPDWDVVSAAAESRARRTAIGRRAIVDEGFEIYVSRKHEGTYIEDGPSLTALVETYERIRATPAAEPVDAATAGMDKPAQEQPQ